jgi:hypothetical protein
MKKKIDRLERLADVKQPVTVLEDSETGKISVDWKGVKHNFSTRSELESFVDENGLKVGVYVRGWGLGI